MSTKIRYSIISADCRHDRDAGTTKGRWRAEVTVLAWIGLGGNVIARGEGTGLAQAASVAFRKAIDSAFADISRKRERA